MSRDVHAEAGRTRVFHSEPIGKWDEKGWETWGISSLEAIEADLKRVRELGAPDTARVQKLGQGASCLAVVKWVGPPLPSSPEEGS